MRKKLEKKSVKTFDLSEGLKLPQEFYTFLNLNLMISNKVDEFVYIRLKCRSEISGKP